MKKPEKHASRGDLRKARCAEIKERQERFRTSTRLRSRLRRNQAKQHAKIGLAAADLVGLDMEEVRREHRKADDLIRRQLAEDRKRMKAEAAGVRKADRRRIAQARRAAKAYHAERQTTNPTCIWRAGSTDRVQTGEAADSELIEFTYGQSDGRNEISFRIQAESTDPYATRDGAYTYLFNFYYERENTGVVEVGSWVGSNGFLTARSSVADSCCGFDPPSLARVDVNAYLAATTIDQNGNPQTWSPHIERLGFVSAAGQDFEEDRLTDDAIFAYPSLLPVIGGTPVVISVGVEVWYALWGTAEIEAEFYSPSAFEADVPYVVVSGL